MFGKTQFVLFIINCCILITFEIYLIHIIIYIIA